MKTSIISLKHLIKSHTAPCGEFHFSDVVIMSKIILSELLSVATIYLSDFRQQQWSKKGKATKQKRNKTKINKQKHPNP